MKKFKDVHGRTRIEVKNGETPPPQVTESGITPQQLSDTFESKFNTNFTDGLVLDTIADKLEDSAIIKGMSRLTYSSYQDLEKVNEVVGQIDRDQTKTTGAKILAKDKLTKRYFKEFEDRLNALSIELIQSIDKDAKKLFSNNLELNSLEQSLLPAYVTKGQDTDISVYAGTGTKSESKIALTIMRDFPHLVDTHSTFKEATFFANYQHSGDIAMKLETMVELNDHLQTMVGKYNKAKQSFINPDVLDVLNRSKIEIGD